MKKQNIGKPGKPHLWILVFLILLIIIASACAKKTVVPTATVPLPTTSIPNQQPTITISPNTLNPTLVTTVLVTTTQEIGGEASPTPGSSGGCPLSVQLRRDNADLILKYRPQIVSASEWAVAAQYFSLLEGSTRVLLGASLAEMQKMIADVEAAKTPYDGIAYDLEGWAQTPSTEQTDPVAASKQAADMAHAHGKILVLVPGSKFMEQNPQYFAGMAANADSWVIQSQRYQGQLNAGPEYRNAVMQIISKIRAGNATVPIWVQLSVTPGRSTPLSVETLLSFRELIINDIAGISLFDLLDPNKPATLQGMFDAICKQ